MGKGAAAPNHSKVSHPILDWKAFTSGKTTIQWRGAVKTQEGFPPVDLHTIECDHLCKRVWLKTKVQIELRRYKNRSWRMWAVDAENIEFDKIPDLLTISGFGGRASVALYDCEWWVILSNRGINWENYKKFNGEREDKINRLMVLHNIRPVLKYGEKVFNRAILDKFVLKEMHEVVVDVLPKMRVWPE